MGKKSRKKVAAKGTRKDPQSSRREQQSPAAPSASRRPQRNFGSNAEYSNSYQREYFVGDRVWFDEREFFNPCNPNTFRGMVRGILPDGQLHIISLQSIIDGDERAILTIAKEYVYPDFEDIMLRFDIGDSILYHCGHWSTGKVELQWPIREVIGASVDAAFRFPRYKCSVDWGDPDMIIPYIDIPADDDSVIKLRPTKFRFKVGDAVDINSKSKKVETTNGRSAAKLAQSKSLMRGKITAVDVSKPNMNYAVYECTFGKALSCRIWEDTDEYISRADADPRERLFDAIEQNCSREHLEFLCSEYNIDVMTFRDLIVAKAIESASLQALSWLQHSCKIDVLSMKDDSGNTLLHQIAKSTHAARFIREAGRSYCDRDVEKMLDFTGRDTSSLLHRNDDGELWIQILIKRRDVKAFDAALSPHCGFAWVLGRPDTIQLIQESVRVSEVPIMRFIFDSFVSFLRLKRQFSSLLYFNYSKTEDELLDDSDLVAFREGDANEAAKLLVRYCHDWCKHRSKKVYTISQCCAARFVLNGYSQLFQSFYEADESIFRNKTYMVESKEDKGEYIQHQVDDRDDEEHDCDIEVDIFSACIIGRNSFQARDEWDKNQMLCYLYDIKRYATNFDGRGRFSLKDHLQEYRAEDKDEEIYAMHLHRLTLLEDDNNTEGRQKILEYLLRKDPSIKLDILLPIKHRQCWALRFMIDQRMVQMDSLAIRSRSLITAAQGLLFLQDGRLEKTSLKSCLCFAAVQYDDLQSLEYLCESYGTPVEMIGGWNLLQFSAYMGRIEIIAWLSSQSVWDSLSTQICVRKEFEGALAVHISARLGHLLACELMIELKVPLDDSNGRIPEDYAKMSSHEDVLDWVKRKETPKILKADVDMVFKLAKSCTHTGSEIKDFIKSSTCLDIPTWDQCGYSSFDAVGPTGHSFGDVLNEVCGAVDIEVAVWICKRLYFWTGYDFQYERFWKNSEQQQRESDAGMRKHFQELLEKNKISVETYENLTEDLLPFQQEDDVKEEKMLDQHDLVAFLRNEGYGDYSDSLCKKWFKKVSCKEPLTSVILTTALDQGKRLEIVRAAILLNHIQLAMTEVIHEEFEPLFARGGGADELEELTSIQSNVINALVCAGYDTSTTVYNPSQYRHTIFGQIDMDLKLYSIKYEKGHPVKKQLLFLYQEHLWSLHVVLATEGYAELMNFCLSNLSEWTPARELEVVRISSYLGHTDITEMFLDGASMSFKSSAVERRDEAILAAGEALRCHELESLVDRFGIPYDPIVDFDIDKGVTEIDEFLQELSESLIVCVMNGYLRETLNHDADNKTMLKTLTFLVDSLEYSHDEILTAIILIANIICLIEEMETLFEIVQNVVNVMKLQPMKHSKRMRQLCEAVINQIFLIAVLAPQYHASGPEVKKEGENYDTSSTFKWLSKMADLGIDVQKLLEGSKFKHIADRVGEMRKKNLPFFTELRDLEEKQQRKWSNFATIKNGSSLQVIQKVVESGELKLDARDRGGLLLTHLSGAYDRVDVLEWLIATKGMQLNSTDGENRTVLEVAEASKASKAMKWIAEWNARNKIISFLRRNYFRAMQNRRLQRSKSAATLIQRLFRGYCARKLYSGALKHRLEESKQFYDIWGHIIGSMPRFSPMSWSSTREKHLDIQVGLGNELIEETDRRLRDAADVAVDQDVEDDIDNVTDEVNADSEIVTINDEGSSAEGVCTSCNEWLSFQMTSHVVKFLQQGDKKYRSFFVRRMQQLARGERSRILKKPLKGSQSHIFETYLEQKSGHRILWTEEGGNIVVWYVARHKQVSRLMQLIDDSKSRSARQQMPQTLSDELRNEGFVPSTEPKREVLLDIIGNVPLKVYDISFNNINEIAKDSWTPRLHLTEEERDIVEADGTVLVLGRSGTGKTVCICNRIECDRQSRVGQDPSFTQLFVARSMRLCKYVEGTVGEDHRTSFCTYSRLLSDIEATLPDQQDRRNFNPSCKMDFQRFKQEFCNSLSTNIQVSALILWTVIRTFLKGSIEAFQCPSGVLAKEDFVEVERLGKNRCRIPEELRGYIYDEFLRYESYLKEHKLWDDCDRVRHLMIGIKESKKIDPDAFGQVQKSRVYVDEVQDYTQLEILLFFYLCGPNGLFLAGDPAQSVVEGTEFRFEEVRSVGHFVCSLIKKPKTVNVNFRSHSGILNCAGGVLDLLFTHFPSSAKQLKKDEGLFQGSRPGILSGASINQLNVLLSDKLRGAVLLTHDESARHWRRRLNDYKRVYGIREAKGLEFKTVIILDFFGELSPSLQKPWRELVLDRAEQDFEYKHPLVGNMLKLLYTGVTRCIEKLFFAETRSSTAGKASIRWLTKQIPGSSGCFATMNNIDDIETMSMTADEFVGEGINNAELSESAEDLDEAERYLERAVWCFEQADNADLAAKARIQQSSVLFRRDLLLSKDEISMNNHAVIELKAANLMVSLCREGLFIEVLSIYYAVKPYLSEYACEQLERELVSKIRLAERG